ncbi:unnamed protein product [Didymodactylos carnosus]|uniref:Uncharacterized protein n=1 Tax=Didymodactylos carnosus TaxID=1234261 RepID=A0A814GTS7_9BILA|nr:unnamed protein product [Didymodactylos carnosus]CAF1000897.1 unnamed protein product [Didymodactylos carnosus]CAF3750751.1 unnamed protein product [Didymodactylos carnosus]CAF3772361.1 unnamed protein product [Didymodactylos carnosus]
MYIRIAICLSNPLSSAFWQATHCVKTLSTETGQGTIVEVTQVDESVPFHVLLKNRRNFSKKNQYWLVLSVDNEKVLLQKIVNGHQKVLKQATAHDHILQTSHPNGYKYWLSIDYKTLVIKYGRGEMRNECTLFCLHMADADDKKYLPKLKYTYLKQAEENEEESSEKTSTCHEMYDHPVSGVIPTYVIEEEMIEDQPKNKSLITAEDLDKPNQRLYKTIMDFKLTDPTFPNFIDAIEQSGREPSGWCHKTLREAVPILTTTKRTTAIVTTTSESAEQPPLPMKPLHVATNPDLHVTFNETYTITCIVYVSGSSNVSFRWIQVAPKIRYALLNHDGPGLKETLSTEVILFSRIKIDDKSKLGNYTCYVEDEAKNWGPARMTIHLLNSDTVTTTAENKAQEEVETTVGAVCSPQCENNGRCVNANVCQCANGWTGSDCTIRAHLRFQ